jgi:hypothetical protein
LADEATPYLWSDAVLNDFLDEALAELGRLVPANAVQVGTMTLGQRAYPLPVDCLRPIRLEWPAGRFVPLAATRVPASGGSERPWTTALAQAWHWQQWPVPLLLVQVAPTTIDHYRLHYLVRRPGRGDDRTALPLTEDEATLASLWACQLAWEHRQLEEAKRGRPPVALPAPFADRLDRLLRQRRRIARGELMQP